MTEGGEGEPGISRLETKIRVTRRTLADFLRLLWVHSAFFPIALKCSVRISVESCEFMLYKRESYLNRRSHKCFDLLSSIKILRKTAIFQCIPFSMLVSI